MSGRQSLLDPKDERLLKRELKKLWMIKDEHGGWKFNGRQIAKMLGFGVEGSPFEALRPEYVYNYRQKFDLPIRFTKKSYPHRYKNGKVDEPIDLADWMRRIDAIPEGSFHGHRKRTYNETIFWTGLRNTELRMLVRNDVILENDRIIINAFRLKKGRNVTRKEAIYPLELRMNWVYVPEIYDYINRYSGEELLWDVSRWSAWMWVKEVYPESYPHHLRLNRITALCSDPRISIAEIRAWTGLHLVTINVYISKSGRFVTTVADKMGEIMGVEKNELGSIMKQINNLSEEDVRKLATILNKG
jgi:hypothetical protein